MSEDSEVTVVNVLKRSEAEALASWLSKIRISSFPDDSSAKGAHVIYTNLKEELDDGSHEPVSED